MKKEAKLIFSPQLANFLLSRGYQIIKLKPKRGSDTDSVFVFRVDDYFYETVEEWTSYQKEMEE